MNLWYLQCVIHSVWYTENPGIDCKKVVGIERQEWFQESKWLIDSLEYWNLQGPCFMSYLNVWDAESSTCQCQLLQGKLHCVPAKKLNEFQLVQCLTSIALNALEYLPSWQLCLVSSLDHEVHHHSMSNIWMVHHVFRMALCAKATQVWYLVSWTSAEPDFIIRYVALIIPTAPIHSNL